MNDKELSKKINHNLWWVKVATIIGILVVLFYIYFFRNQGISSNSNIWGSFGEYVGGIVGTILIFVTVILLYKSLTTQMLEFFKLSKLQTEQNFDSMLFNLLEAHNYVLDNIQGKRIIHNRDKTIYTGKLYVEFFVMDLARLYKKDNDINDIIHYLKLKKSIFQNLIIYFNNIIDFVKKNENEDKIKKYLEYIRIQVSNCESIVIAYYLTNKDWSFNKQYFNTFLEANFFKYLDLEKDLKDSEKIIRSVIDELIDNKIKNNE